MPAKHQDLEPKSKRHRPGCLVGHESHYIEGNSCSYRWHAARRARADTRIQYVNPNAVADQRWYESELKRETVARWVRHGKAKDFATKGGRLTFTHDSFTTGWWPWKNEIHHIIPCGSLNAMLEDLSQKADPRHRRALTVMIHGLLGEPYNINDEPNVLALPILDADADAMGLPRHLAHGKYNEAVRREMVKRVEPQYRSLISAIKAKEHPRREKAPAVRPVLEALSIETYEAILSKTSARREAGRRDVTLDDIAPVLYR